MTPLKCALIKEMSDWQFWQNKIKNKSPHLLRVLLMFHEHSNWDIWRIPGSRAWQIALFMNQNVHSRMETILKYSSHFFYMFTAWHLAVRSPNFGLSATNFRTAHFLNQQWHCISRHMSMDREIPLADWLWYRKSIQKLRNPSQEAIRKYFHCTKRKWQKI